MSTAASYVPYSDGVEDRTPDEDAVIASIVASMARMNADAAKRYHHGVRDAHAKSHGALRGELTVLPDLPEPVRQGLFATPRSYPVIARLSSAAAEIRSDQVQGLRGFAIKVLGVEGPRALPDDDGTNQDFLLVNKPTIAFGDVHAYKKAMPAAALLAKAPDVVLKAGGLLARTITGVLNVVRLSPPDAVALFAGPNNHILGQTYHSMAALRYGDYIAKLSLAPYSESLRSLAEQPVDSTLGAEALRSLIVDYFRADSAEYLLRAQLCTDLDEMPVEKASVLWPEDLSPHVPIAKLTFPIQNAYSPARAAYVDDTMSFNPWHGLAAHRPLGSIMRVRIKAYAASSEFRHTTNGVKSVEPQSISELPD